MAEHGTPDRAQAGSLKRKRTTDASTVSFRHLDPMLSDLATAVPSQPDREPSTPSGSRTDYPRRRATIACEVCRARKTRCDGSKPKCRLCTDLGAECLYREPAQRLDMGDRTILDQLQRLENMIAAGRNTEARRDVPAAGVAQASHTPQAPMYPQASQSALIPHAGRAAKASLFSELLTWPAICTIPGRHVDDKGLGRIELSRPSLSGPKAQKYRSDDILECIRGYLEGPYKWKALLCHENWEEIIKVAKRNDFDSGIESCLVLLAASSACSMLVPPITAKSSFEDPGTALLRAALPLIGEALVSSSMVAAQCLVFATTHLTVVRPMQAWHLINLVGEKIDSMRRTSLIDEKHSEELRRLYWNFVLCRAELADLLGNAVEVKPVPYTMGLPLETRKTLQFSRTSDDVSVLLARIGLHRVQSMVKSALSIGPDKTVDMELCFSMALESETRLGLWYDNLPKAIRFQEKHFPTSDWQMGLRFGYFACRAAMFRPFILAALQDEDLADEPNIRAFCKKCLEASVRQVEYTALIHSNQLRPFSTIAHSIVAEALLLHGMTRSLALHELLPAPPDMNGLMAEVVESMEKADRDSSLWRKLEVLQRGIGLPHPFQVEVIPRYNNE